MIVRRRQTLTSRTHCSRMGPTGLVRGRNINRKRREAMAERFVGEVDIDGTVAGPGVLRVNGRSGTLFNNGQIVCGEITADSLNVLGTNSVLATGETHVTHLLADGDKASG